MPMNSRLLRPLARLQPQPPAFDPSSISGLAMWLDASDATTITATSDQVSEWRDKSGNSRHATQETANNMPTLYDGSSSQALLGTRQSLWFDGANDTMLTPSFAIAQPLTFAFAFRPTSVSVDSGFLFDGASGDRTVFYMPFATGIARIYAGVESTDSSPMVLGVTQVCTVIFDGVTSVLRMNGTQEFSGNAGTNGIDDGLVIGSYDTTVAFFAGYLGELLVYSGALSSQDISDIESYLTARWS